MLRLGLLVCLLPAFGTFAQDLSVDPLVEGPLAERGGQTYRCKCYPGDRCYPSDQEWRRLNSTVGGNLQVAIHPAAPCYASMNGIPTFNAEKCAEVTANIPNQQWTCVKFFDSVYFFSDSFHV